jgi:hypothetical protein
MNIKSCKGSDYEIEPLEVFESKVNRDIEKSYSPINEANSYSQILKGQSVKVNNFSTQDEENWVCTNLN